MSSPADKQSRYFSSLSNSNSFSLDTPYKPSNSASSSTQSTPNSTIHYQINSTINHSAYQKHKYGNKYAQAGSPLSPSKSLRPIFTSSCSTPSPSRNSPRYFTSVSNQNSPHSPTSRFNKSKLNNLQNMDYHALPPLPSESSPFGSPTSASNSGFLSGDEDEYDGNTSFFNNDQFDEELPLFQSTYQSPSTVSPTSSSSSSSLTIPLTMKIIINSRTKKSHNLKNFVNQSYSDFWNLTTEEGLIFKDWNKLEFEIQSLLFEIFNNLQKIKFNLYRLIFVYAENFKNYHLISESTFKNTFDVLKQFYYFLEKLLEKKMKPLFDDNFIVNDYKVLSVLLNWFKQLKSQYRTISGSIIYISKLFNDSNVKEVMMKISVQDDDLSNRSAVSTTDLFNSYFIKIFTSIQLLFNRLSNIYASTNNLKLVDISKKIESIIVYLNNLSDNVSDLDKKIEFNDKLSYKSKINFSQMEMVDIFNENRKLIEPIKIELKGNLGWMSFLLVSFDNYLLFLKEHDSKLILSKQPIPIQYVTYTEYVENNYKVVNFRNLTDISTTFHIRRKNDLTVKIFDNFLKNLEESRIERWTKVNVSLELKLFNFDTFISKSISAPIDKSFSSIDNPISTILKDKKFVNQEKILLNVLSCDYFSFNSEKLCLIGTSYGIYMSDFKKVRKVHQMENVRKITILNNEKAFVIGGSNSLFRLSIERFYKTFQFDLPPLDLNIFEENFQNIENFTIGYQKSAESKLEPHLFLWKQKNIYFTKLEKPNYKFTFENFKTFYNILSLKTVYSNNFAISHISNNSANWEICKLQDLRAISLIPQSFKDFVKNETPISVFPFPNKLKKVNEFLLIFSKFAIRLIIDNNGKYVQSNEEILWFGIKCESTNFDYHLKHLLIVNNKAIEVWKLYESFDKKSQLIGCLLGNSIKLINEMPDKWIIKMDAEDEENSEEAGYKNQIIFKVRRSKKE